jgi:putative tryptophan/tyrosine transport system substrate-binding protein
MTKVSGRKSEVSKSTALTAMLSGLSLFGALLFALCFPAQAQQPKKVPRIGYLSAGPPSNSPNREAFRQGLRELGYIEGKNILVEYRYMEGKGGP